VRDVEMVTMVMQQLNLAKVGHIIKEYWHKKLSYLTEKSFELISHQQQKKRPV
jgi:hypothetical protein